MSRHKPEPKMVAGATIEITQDGKDVGGDRRLKLGAKFIIISHRLKHVAGGSLGVWRLQAYRGTDVFDTVWLRAKVIRPAPVKCPGCGNGICPNMDGTFNRHGSLGWSCDGKTKSTT